MDLRRQLQSTLGAAYSLERELGGGGMSRVFMATETALGRNVVVKVLPPELVQGVSVERFKREIQLAAQLQHPHIVPVLTSGETDGLPYYTMPFVDGTSLRARLAHGPLPMGETIGYLRDAAKALAYAHERGVVHRDIKPDNVLITGGSAVVTDFGIAKALSASRTPSPGGTLTQIGTSIGTPAYMAPEQAAADPSTDHRADIYSFGCMAYEMLAGRPPFVDRTPQRLLAAHMAEAPRPIGELRPDTPPLLAELVMRCLAKDADQRPQSALDLVRVLESVTTSGSAHAAMPSILLGGRQRLWRALAAYAAAFVVVAIVAKAAIVGIGLPTWVLPGSVMVMALGLPAILFTAFVHNRAHDALTMATVTPGGSPATQSTMARIAVKASPWVNWRRTTIGGFVAIGAFVLLVGGYMALRAFGIGPAGSLMASGALGESEKILVADFKSPASDTTLGPVVTEAFRSDLAQSRQLSVVQATTIRATLTRMQKSPDSHLDFTLAREIATRDGVKAVIDGEVLSLGGGYVIVAKLYSAQTGELLAPFRVTADKSSDIIPAIDKLSRDVRAKAGESLRLVNAAKELEQVTTPSLEALKKYVQAVRTFREQSDFARGISLLQEAIALDTSFAMAYRKLAIEYGNQGGYNSQLAAAIEKAFQHKDRLSDVERYLTEGAYYAYGPHSDPAKASAAYDALLDIDPKNQSALNNAANDLNIAGQFEKAESYARRAVEASPTAWTYFANLYQAQLGQRKFVAAESTIVAFREALPSSPMASYFGAYLLVARDKLDSATTALLALRATTDDPSMRKQADFNLADMGRRTGRLTEAEKFDAEAFALAANDGSAGAPLANAVQTALAQIWFLGDTTRALKALQAALDAHPLEKIPALDRPFVLLARAYAAAGRIDRAKSTLAAFDQVHPNAAGFDAADRHQIAGVIALGDARYDDAIREYTEGGKIACPVCSLGNIARAYDLAGRSDSAIAVMNRYVDGPPSLDRFPDDGWMLAGTHKRLGELYEAKGDRAAAASHYAKFIELWNRADPGLQPKVAEVRKRLARLSDSEKR